MKMEEGTIEGGDRRIKTEESVDEESTPTTHFTKSGPVAVAAPPSSVNLVEVYQSAFKRRAASVSSVPDSQAWYNGLSTDDRAIVDLGLTAMAYRGCMLAAKRSFDKIVMDTVGNRAKDPTNSSSNNNNSNNNHTNSDPANTGRKTNQPRSKSSTTSNAERNSRNTTRPGGRMSQPGPKIDDRGKWRDNDRYGHYGGSRSFSPSQMGGYNNGYNKYAPPTSQSRYDDYSYEGRYDGRRSGGSAPQGRDRRVDDDYYSDRRHHSSSKRSLSPRSGDEEEYHRGRRRSRRHPSRSSSSESSRSRHRSRRRRSASRSHSRGRRRSSRHDEKRRHSSSRSSSADHDRLRRSSRHHHNHHSRHPEEGEQHKLEDQSPLEHERKAEEGSLVDHDVANGYSPKTHRRSKRRADRDDREYRSSRRHHRSRSRSHDRKRSKKNDDKAVASDGEDSQRGRLRGKEAESPRKSSKKHHRRKSDKKRRSDVSPSPSDRESPPSDRKKKSGRESSSARSKRRKTKSDGGKRHSHGNELPADGGGDEHSFLETGEVVQRD